MEIFNAMMYVFLYRYSTFLLDRGRVHAVGDNKMGQLGIGTQSALVPSPTRVSNIY